MPETGDKIDELIRLVQQGQGAINNELGNAALLSRKMEFELERLAADVNEIKKRFDGNGKEGIISRLAVNEERLRTISKLVWGAIGAATAALLQAAVDFFARHGGGGAAP